MQRTRLIRGALPRPTHDKDPIRKEIDELFSPKKSPLSRMRAFALSERKQHIDTVRSLLAPAYNEIVIEEDPITYRKIAGKIAFKTYTSSLLLSAAAADTITFALGLMLQDEDFLGFLKKTDERIYLLSAFYFAQYLVIAAPYVDQGMKDSIDIIKYRTLPADWGYLSKKQEILAALIGLSFAAYSVTGETTATHRFWKDFGASVTTAGILACMYGQTSLLSESRKAWENIRNIFIFFNEKAYRGKFSLTPAKLLGYVLALFSAVGAMILGYDGTTNELDIQDFTLKIFLLSFALSKGFTDISLNGKINVDAIQELAGHTPPAEQKEIAPPASIVFKGAAGISSLLFSSIVVQSFAKIYINSLATAALPFSMPTIIPPGLGYGIAVSQGTNITYGTYEFFNILRKGMHLLMGHCRNRGKTKDIEQGDFNMEMPPVSLHTRKIDDDVYIDLPADESKKSSARTMIDITPYTSGNASVKFAPAKTIALPPISIKQAPTHSDKSRCVIL